MTYIEVSPSTYRVKDEVTIDDNVAIRSRLGVNIARLKRQWWVDRGSGTGEMSIGRAKCYFMESVAYFYRSYPGISA